MNLFSLFAVLLLVTQNYVPLKGCQQQNQAQTRASETKPPAPSSFASKVAEENAADAERYAYYKTHHEEYLKAAIAPANASNWVLAGLGVVGGIIGLLTLFSIKYQIGLMIKKERARIRVNMGKVEYGRGVVEVIYTVTCNGSTPAFVRECWASATTSRSDTAIVPKFKMPMHLPHTFREGEVENSAYVLNQTSFSEQDIADFHAQKLFMHVSGGIKYEDIFGKKRKTTFRYVCKTTDYVGLDGSIHQYWFTQGKKYNRAT